MLAIVESALPSAWPESLTKIQRTLNSCWARLLVIAALVSEFVWTFWFEQPTIGYSFESRNGIARVSAGTTPQLIIIALLSVAFYFFLLNHEVDVKNPRIAPMWSRAAAFIIDFWFAVFTSGSLAAFIPLMTEAVRTGGFRWHFKRDYLVPADEAGFALVLVGLAILAAYFLFPLVKKSQTIGCWIFRLATVDEERQVIHLSFSRAVLRLLAELRGLCSPIKTFRTRDKEGKTFYDKSSGFTVVRY